MDTTPEDPFDELLRQARREERLARLSGRAAGRDAAAPTAGAAARPQRRHAAKGSRSAALGLSVVSTLGLATWLHQAAGATTTGALAATATTDTASASVAASPTSTSATPTTSTTAATNSTTTKSTSTTLADGQYTGTSSTTRWGPVQVRITVSGGRITAVDVLSYPSNDNKSRSINATAVPRLVQSSLTAQSASVSSVSGATYTSAAYKTSLQSAIDQARAKA